MKAYVKVDDVLIEDARRLGGHKTKKAAAVAALMEYIQHYTSAQDPQDQRNDR